MLDMSVDRLTVPAVDGLFGNVMNMLDMSVAELTCQPSMGRLTSP